LRGLPNKERAAGIFTDLSSQIAALPLTGGLGLAWDYTSCW